MARKKRVRAAPFTWWLLPGCGISLVVFAAGFLGLAIVPWSLYLAGSYPGQPPQPLDLPWVSGLFGWSFVLFCVGLTALTIWLERGHERRVEPLALIALCLAVLGHAELIYGSNAAASTDNWPVNVIEVSFWILIAAGGVGALAWVRMLFARDPVRGRVFATCALACSLSSAWMVHRFLIDGWPLLPPVDGIELPVAFHSSVDKPDPDGPRPEVLVWADGTITHGPLEELAVSAPQVSLESVDLPDIPILIRADRRAPWAAVRDALLAVQEARFWKVMLATRWEEPAVATKIPAYLPKQVNVYVEDAEPVPAAGLLHVSASRALTLDGVPFEDRDALHECLELLHHASDGEGWLQIDVDQDASWEGVIAAISAARHSFRSIRLGPFQLEV